MKQSTSLLCTLLLLFTACNSGNSNSMKATDEAPLNTLAPFKLVSSAFTEGGLMPPIYTCDSTDISPPLSWNNPFKNVVSFAIINDDPDAPMGTWVHWVIYNIPPTDTVLQANVPRDSVLANGTKQGISSFKVIGYGGPCPPNGTHRYYFKLYALDIMLPLPACRTKTQVMNAMKGHILAEADLMGKYARVKK